MKKLLLIISILLISTASYAQTYTVQRIVNGDTIVVFDDKGISEKVRLIGINAPESQPNNKARRESKQTGYDVRTITRMGQKSTKFLEGMIKVGHKVIVQIDKQYEDQYGSRLGYVFIDTPIGHRNKAPKYATKFPFLVLGSKDAYRLFLNATIINAGYATLMTIPPNVKYADLFRRLYEEAREQKRGLWKDN